MNNDLTNMLALMALNIRKYREVGPDRFVVNRAPDPRAELERQFAEAFIKLDRKNPRPILHPEWVMPGLEGVMDDRAFRLKVTNHPPLYNLESAQNYQSNTGIDISEHLLAEAVIPAYAQVRELVGGGVIVPFYIGHARVSVNPNTFEPEAMFSSCYAVIQPWHSAWPA